jgi:ribosomal protein S18 acetylase RimI-like enzyme
MQIRVFQPDDQLAVIALWQRCDLLRPWNDPVKDMARKMADSPEWFLLGELQGQVVAGVMAGYDGHRGWLNYLAVDPEYQRQGLARQLVQHAEALLLQAGCPKINLQVRSSNQGVITFYQQLGYGVDEVVSLGKRLIRDDV